MQTFTYTPKGVCATKFVITIDKHKIVDFKATNGCAGNLAGISKLIQGMPVEDVINRLKGVTCRVKPTSCPDQLAQFLMSISDQLTN